MKVIYNEEEKLIEINDGMRKQNLLLKFLFVLNLINPIVHLSEFDGVNFDFIDIVWVMIAIVSLVTLVFMILKKSTAERIKIEDIKGIKEASFIGRKRLSIKLTNGKHRDLYTKTALEYNDLCELFKEIGISY